MNDNIDMLPLTATLPASELAQMRRRLIFLEAAMVQVLRDQGRIREWFTAAELAALRLPGLPTTKAAITRAARAQGWLMRAGPDGGRIVYHFASLPRRAFQELIDRVLKGPAPAVGDDQAAMPAVAPPPPPPPAPSASNAAPPWVLPLMRVIRKQRAPSLAKAVQQLPKHLPAGIGCPTLDEARRVLTSLGVKTG
jgi:hypothetical protein